MTRRALEIRRQIFPADHPAIANSLYSVGTQHLYRDEIAAAEPFIRESAEVRERLYGRSDWRTIQADARLGLIHSRLQVEGAGEELLDAQERARVEFGAEEQWLQQQIDDAVVEHQQRAEGSDPD